MSMKHYKDIYCLLQQICKYPLKQIIQQRMDEAVTQKGVSWHFPVYLSELWMDFCEFFLVEVEQSLTPHPTQYRSFRRRSSQPITWLILTNKAVQENKHAKTKYKSNKGDKLKYRKTKLPWFSRLLRHSDRKRGGLILQWYQRSAPKPTRAFFGGSGRPQKPID